MKGHVSQSFSASLAKWLLATEFTVMENQQAAPATTVPGGQEALQIVQGMVAESVKKAVDQATERLLMAVDQRIAAARSPPSPSTQTSQAQSQTGQMGSPAPGIRLPRDGEVHPSGIPSNLARFQLQQIPGQRMATTNAANEGSGSSRQSLSPSTPLAEVVGTSHGGSDSQASGTAAIAVGVNTPPIPLKLAEKIW